MQTSDHETLRGTVKAISRSDLASGPHASAAWARLKKMLANKIWIRLDDGQDFFYPRERLEQSLRVDDRVALVQNPDGRSSLPRLVVLRGETKG